MPGLLDELATRLLTADDLSGYLTLQTGTFDTPTIALDPVIQAAGLPWAETNGIEYRAVSIGTSSAHYVRYDPSGDVGIPADTLADGDTVIFVWEFEGDSDERFNDYYLEGGITNEGLMSTTSFQPIVVHNGSNKPSILAMPVRINNAEDGTVSGDGGVDTSLVIGRIDARLRTNGSGSDAPLEGCRYLGLFKGPDTQRSILNIILDDTDETIYTEFYPRALANNIPFALAINPANIKPAATQFAGLLTTEMIHEMRDSGIVTFCNHTWQHERLPDESQADMETAINLGFTGMEVLGVRSNVDLFVFPYGDYNQRELDYLQTIPGCYGAYTTRREEAGNVQFDYIGLGNKPLNPWEMKRAINLHNDAVNGVTDDVEALALLDRAIDVNAVIATLMGHGFEASPDPAGNYFEVTKLDALFSGLVDRRENDGLIIESPQQTFATANNIELESIAQGGAPTVLAKSADLESGGHAIPPDWRHANKR